MPRKKKGNEIIHGFTLKNQAVRAPSADLQAVIEGIIRKRVDEILASSATIDGFRPAEVAKTARRVNHIFESKKWGMYFAKFGCLICGKAESAGTTYSMSCNGMCNACGGRVQRRLQNIKRDFEAAHPQEEIERNIEKLTLRARTAERLLREE